MRSESSEERGLQKPAGRPSYRIENEYNPEAMPQYFQISVGVLEGRNFAWQNPRSANSFVIITLGKKKHRTGIQRNKQEPLYRESFSFEMYATMYDLQRSTLCLTVMESRCYVSPHLLGEVTIDLAAIWEQPLNEIPYNSGTIISIYTSHNYLLTPNDSNRCRYLSTGLNHRVFHKWAQLSLPRDPTAGSVGFLKVDISIICRGDLQSLMTYKTERNVVPVNYFVSSGSEQQHANFMMTIHGAFGLPNTSRHQSARHHCAKPPSTFVRVFFCGLQAKTAVQNRCNNPKYSERVSMVEMFPNSRQTFRIEVCSSDSTFSKILASTFLNLDNISHDGENGYLPTFGPSLLPLYGSPSGSSAPEDCPYYRGSLLVSLNTVVPYYQQSLRSVSVEPVSPIPVENLWALRDFCIFCPIFEVSMLDSRVVSHSGGVAVTIGELPTGNSSEEEFTSMMDAIKTRKLHYTGSIDVLRTKSEYGHLDFSNSFPILQAATRLPDYRDRIYRNNAIARIVRELESVSKEVDDRLKRYDYNEPEELVIELNTAFDNTIVRITAFIDIFSEDWEQQYRTDLDKKQIVLQIAEMIRIRNEISQNIIASIYQRASFNSKNNCNVTRKTVKNLMAKVHTVVYQLKKLIFKATEGWPDLVIWLLNDGSRVGFCKIRTADVIYSDKFELCGEKCGQITTCCFKPLKCSRHVSSLSVGCFCVVGKVELLPWMGLHEHGPVFERTLPTGCKLKIKDFDMCVKCGGILVECRVFIHKARILCNTDSNLRYVFLRVNTLNTTKESEIIEISSAPVWNQILRLRTIMFTSSDRLTKFPPVVLVEVIITDLKNKTDIVGSFEMNSVVDDRSDFNIAPKLQWHEVYNGMESTAKVFMSVQILQITERVLKSTIYNPIQETFIASDIKEFIEPLSEFETLPSYLIPDTSTYKIDIYWWGLRNIDIAKKPSVVLEIEDIALKSDVITDRRINCNFSNPRINQVFEASFAKHVCTTLYIKLYDNCTFGRTVSIGKKTVKKPNKFFINWYTKDKRDTSLRQAPITSADFIKVSQTLYIKKRNPFMQDNENLDCSESSSILANNQMEPTGWRRLFRRKELDEEEYTLLPVFTKQCTTNINKKNNLEHTNWWSRYVLSQQTYAAKDHDNAHRITIYDSELEHQPQFSKFKDWCATLKLYSGEKTGVPEKDLELQCGFLKAGIVIYKWPPPDNVVAVSSDGVDLTKGFFYNCASNEPAKFLIRVYIIKAFNLTTKSFAGKSNPYVVVSCGGKNLGDRNNYIKNTYNPVFGTLFELRCTLPEDYQLSVSLYNYDLIEPDGLLGSTTVDLEDRIYTKHRACIGLPSAYNLSDPGKWRDFKKPSAILEEICLKNHLIKPGFPDDSTVVVNGIEYKDNDQARSYLSALERRENICLNLLRNWEKMTICGYHLVPEHVETRSLYIPEVAGIEQGKLHMWIDIFPHDSDVYIPPSVDITPNKSEKYKLKVTIFRIKIFKNHTKDSLLSDRKIHVRAWLGYADQVQSTNFRDISLDGDYDFNWSMIFNFNYEHIEKKIVRNEANQSFTDSDESVSPIFIVQLMDSDYLSSDEPIGFLALNLTEVSYGVKDPRCLLKSKNKTKTTIDLFSTNTIVAWWPLQTCGKLYGMHNFGAIKLGLSLVSQKKTLLMPVGLEKDIQLSSPKTRSRNMYSHKNYSKSNSNLEQLFYNHNALWGSLAGVTIIILVIFTTVYFIYVYV